MKIIGAFRYITIRSLWIALIVVDFLLFVRIILKVFGANPMSPIVFIWYAITGILLLPFYGIFPEPHYSSDIVVDVVAMIALVIYTGLFLTGMVVILLVAKIMRRKEEVQGTGENQQ